MVPLFSRRRGTPLHYSLKLIRANDNRCTVMRCNSKINCSKQFFRHVIILAHDGFGLFSDYGSFGDPIFQHPDASACNKHTLRDYLLYFLMGLAKRNLEMMWSQKFYFYHHSLGILRVEGDMNILCCSRPGPYRTRNPEIPESAFQSLKNPTSGTKKRGFLEGGFCKLYASLGCAALSSKCTAGANTLGYFCFLGRDTGLYRNPLC